MILHVENPIDSIHTKTVQLIKEISKVTGYRINIKKSVTFWYALTMNIPKKEIKKTNPFIILSNRTKYLWIKLTKEAED